MPILSTLTVRPLCSKMPVLLVGNTLDYVEVINRDSGEQPGDHAEQLRLHCIGQLRLANSSSVGWV